jgi:hypothetical protein
MVRLFWAETSPSVSVLNLRWDYKRETLSLSLSLRADGLSSVINDDKTHKSSAVLLQIRMSPYNYREMRH